MQARLFPYVSIFVFFRSAQEISAKYPKVEIKTVAADFNTSDTETLFTALAAALKDTPVALLINNVGVSYPYAKFINELSDADMDAMLNVNVVATTRMTRLVLPGMLERKRGAIVNIGSAAGSLHVGDPLYSVYSASKAFIEFFSRSLHTELKGKGVHVQCQIPYFVATKMSKIRSASLFVPSTVSYARASVRQIGYDAVVVPYWSHGLQDAVLACLPDWLSIRLLMPTRLSIRKRGMKKEEEAEAAKKKA